MSETNPQSDSVVFVNVPSTYRPQEDLTVRFERKKDVPSGTRDWVGLFRVGWTSVRDYYTFEWAPTSSENSTDNKVSFSGRRLPPDDSCFYQFCYVSREGVMRGASGPFQFTKAARGLSVCDVESVDIVEEGLESIVELRPKNTESDATSATTKLNDVTEAMSSNASMDESSRRIEEELDLCRKELVALQAEKTALVQSNADLAVQLNDAQNEAKTWQNKHTRLNEQLQKDVAACFELQATNEKLNIRCQDMEMASGELSVQCQQLSAEKDDLLKQLNAAVQQCENLKTTLEAEQQAAKERKDKMEKMLAQSALKVKELEEYVATRDAELTILQQNFRDEKQQLQKNLVEEQKAGAKIQQQLEDKNQQLETQLMMQHTASTAQIQELQKKIDNADKFITQLQVQLLESEQQLKALKESDKSDINTGNVTNELNELDVQPLCQAPSGLIEKAAYEALQVAYENMEKYYRKAISEQDSCYVQLKESQAKAQRLSEQCSDLKRRIEMGKEKYESLAIEFTNLKRQLHNPGYQNKSLDLKQSYSEDMLKCVAAETLKVEERCQKKIKEMEGMVKVQEKQYMQRIEELEILKAESLRKADDDKQKINELEHKLAAAQYSLEELVHDKLDQESQYQITVQELEQSLSEKCKELDSIKQQFTELKDKSNRHQAELQTNYDEAKQELTKRNEECEQLETKIKILECENMQYVTKVNSLEEKLQKARRSEQRPVVQTPPCITRVCPICGTAFPQRMLQSDFEKHVNSHFGC